MQQALSAFETEKAEDLPTHAVKLTSIEGDHFG